MKNYKKIAVAIDFSEQSIKALHKAIDIAKENDASLVLINVIDVKSFGSIPAYDLKYADELERENILKLETLKREVEKRGIEKVEIIVKKDSPKTFLTSLPDVNLIVCGATGLSKIEKVVLGSIAERIVRHSKYDVLIVRND